MRLPGQECCSGLPSLLRGIFLTQDQTCFFCIAGSSPALQADSSQTKPTGNPLKEITYCWQSPSHITSVQSLGHVQVFATPWTAAHQVSLSITNSGACSNSYPSSQWCHPTISSSVVPFSSCLQSFPASGSFPMSQLFPSGGQSIGASASTSVFPMNIEDLFPLGWTSWISLLSKGLSRVFSKTTVQKDQFFGAQLSL